MKKIKNLICILGAAGTMAACSYFDKSEEVDVSAQPPAQTVDLATGQPAQSPVLLAPVEYGDVAKVIHQSSDGRVEIFSLDDKPFEADENGFTPSNNPVEVEPVSAIPAGDEAVHLTYPGVEIFPLDDDMAALIQQRRAVPQPAVGQPLTLMPTPTPVTNNGFTGPTGGGPSVVYFDHDSTSLKPDDITALSNLAGKYTGTDISVVGHASVEASSKDPIQRKIINLKVSMDRALSVARALIEGGIPAERIETKGFGEVQPPMLSDKPIDVASRRVEIYGISVQ